MNKFLAVLKREYLKTVKTWAFLVSTFLMPLMGGLFTLVPMLLFSIQGEPTRIVVADFSGILGERVVQELSPSRVAEKKNEAAEEAKKNMASGGRSDSVSQLPISFIVEKVDLTGRSQEEFVEQMRGRIRENTIDAFLIIPSKPKEPFTFFSRKAGDIVANSFVEDAVNTAVRSQRLAAINVTDETLREINRDIEFTTKKIDETGSTQESGSTFWVGFVVAFALYLVLTIYGQMILGSIVEEKETKIAEVLFSSARPFELMLGKLVGQSLAGLTQIGIWICSAAALLIFAIPQLTSSGLDIDLPSINFVVIALLLLYFLIGFFVYATLFVLVGSVVSTAQEGGQFSMPIILLMLAGFYLCFAIIRDPNSTVSFWASVAPFTAPLTMPVRIMTEMPPLWQIGLSVFINVAAIALLVWIAGRIYRVGMLMTGKRATLPEIYRWIKQS